jgi:hypothetical protein
MALVVGASSKPPPAAPTERNHERAPSAVWPPVHARTAGVPRFGTITFLDGNRRKDGHRLNETTAAGDHVQDT